MLIYDIIPYKGFVKNGFKMKKERNYWLVLTRPLTLPFWKISRAVLDCGGAPIALVSGIGALIWIKKTREKGKWLAILAIILGGIASTFVHL